MSYTKTKKELNQLVADMSGMSLLIHQVHWYMRGKGFLQLHPLMDTWMEEVNEQLDQVSERLITLGGNPMSTFKEYAEASQINQDKGDVNLTIAQQMDRLAENYRLLNAQLQKTLKVAEEEGEHGVLDFMPAFVTEIEKRLWMIDAEMGREPKLLP